MRVPYDLENIFFTYEYFGAGKAGDVSLDAFAVMAQAAIVPGWTNDKT